MQSFLWGHACLAWCCSGCPELRYVRYSQAWDCSATTRRIPEHQPQIKRHMDVECRSEDCCLMLFAWLLCLCWLGQGKRAPLFQVWEPESCNWITHRTATIPGGSWWPVCSSEVSTMRSSQRQPMWSRLFVSQSGVWKNIERWWKMLITVYAFSMQTLSKSPAHQCQQ